MNKPSQKVLIVVPTRELGQQIRDEIYEFSEGMTIYATLCIGGKYIRDQIYQLKRDPHFRGNPYRKK